MKNQKLLLTSCFYAFFCCGIVMLTMGSALPDISSANNLPYTLSGAMLSCFSLGNLASGILSSLAVLYLGPKIAIVLLTLCICLGMSLLASVNAHVLLFAACVLAGLGRGSLITFSQANVSLATNGNTRTTAMLHAVFAAGAILAPVMFSALRVFDWRAGLVVVAVLCAISAVLFMSVKDYPRVPAKSGKSLDFLRDRGFIMLGALMFLYLCCEFALNGWLVTYMTHKNMTMNYSQAMAALLWVVMLVGRLTCAWLSKYVRQKKLLLASCFGSVVFFGCMLASEGRPGVAVSVACLGLCMAGISPIIYASSAQYTNRYPMAMGVLFTAGCTGGTLMPLITGVIAESFGFDGGMTAILAAFIMLFVLAVLHLS
ncbi:MAG: MFS transporter [Synergistaceae bacterium]|nr:MFS transporter [Synergistaceae bacterium]